MNRAELERLDRDALIARAEQAGVSRARILTRPELVDELLLRAAGDQATRERARGLFGRARDLLARVVERGLHLPDAAERIRSLGAPVMNRPSAPAALPTVTLAEIYVAQGHRARAIETLERVLGREPEHMPARTLLVQLRDAAYPVGTPRLPPEPDEGDSTALEGPSAVLAASGLAGAQPLPESAPAALAPSTPEQGEEAEVLNRAAPGRAQEAEPTATSFPESTEAPCPGPSAPAAPAGADVESPHAEPMAMLDEAPLPALYDVDECVAMSVDPTTLYVYWEIRNATLEYLRAAHPGAVVALRFVVVAPTWRGPLSAVRDHDVVAPVGDFFARELPAGSIVRVAIGLRHDAGFDPIAHCPAVEMPMGAPWPVMAEALRRWTPDGIGSGSREVADVTAIERAVLNVWRDSARAERARRVPDAPLGASDRWVVDRSRTS
ncbi:MAG TPA: DUF4912 domain-containing protein [Polyangiaceae bacterium]|nr:DUF4912 domain-containing protein [Polyangiaceae bacterium]